MYKDKEERNKYQNEYKKTKRLHNRLEECIKIKNKEGTYQTIKRREFNKDEHILL